MQADRRLLFGIEGEALDDYGDQLARIQELEAELAEAKERALRFEWARDQLLERCQALTTRIRQLESDGDELFPCDLAT